MITKASRKCVCIFKRVFLVCQVSRRSMQDPIPLKQVVVLIELIILYRSTNSLMLLLSGVKLKSIINFFLHVRNTIKVNNLR